MIKVILLKDAEQGRGVCFAKAVVENNGFELPIATGYVRKTKETVAPKGTVVYDLPDTFLGKLQAITENFTVEETGEVKQVTYLVVA